MVSFRVEMPYDNLQMVAQLDVAKCELVPHGLVRQNKLLSTHVLLKVLINELVKYLSSVLNLHMHLVCSPILRPGKPPI